MKRMVTIALLTAACCADPLEPWSAQINLCRWTLPGAQMRCRCLIS